MKFAAISRFLFGEENPDLSRVRDVRKSPPALALVAEALLRRSEKSREIYTALAFAVHYLSESREEWPRCFRIGRFILEHANGNGVPLSMIGGALCKIARPFAFQLVEDHKDPLAPRHEAASRDMENIVQALRLVFERHAEVGESNGQAAFYLLDTLQPHIASKLTRKQASELYLYINESRAKKAWPQRRRARGSEPGGPR